MKIRCIALDLDGTTLNTKGELSERNRKAIEKALGKGIHIVAASGRPLASLPRELLEIPGIRYAVTSNGTAVYDLETGEVLRQYRMTKDSVYAVMELMKGSGALCEAFIDGKPYAEKRYVEDPVRYGASPHAVSYIQSTREPVEGMERFLLRHADELDCMDVVIKDGERKEELWKTIAEQAPDVYITSSVPQLLEISYKDAGKDSALRFLLKYLGIERKELAAFGDGDNDSGLLRYAGLGIAVSNASARCKEAADRITVSNDEDAVAQEIERLLDKGR